MKTLVHLRLDEPHEEIRPSDSAGSLVDLNVEGTLVPPAIADAFTGYGRVFGEDAGLTAADVVSGASLATRDVTVQAILKWDLDAQNTWGEPGVIVARGKGGAAAEYVSYGLELRVVNAALRVGELRFWWQDTAGVVKTQLGGHFYVPTDGYLLLTATRHWISANQVELRYYAGDQLLADIASVDGDIGGGTTGTFCLGTRFFVGAPERFFWGVLDELRVLDYELSAEEIAATWDRIARLQPRGYRAMRDLFPPGAPISDDPSSRVQKLLRIAGHALGYAAAQVENVRLNLLPDRAFGVPLERWERILKEAPRAFDNVMQRRARLVAHLRRRAGTSIPGAYATIEGLIAAARSQLEFLAFDQTVRDDFSAGLLTERWWAEAPADWTIAAGALRMQRGSSDMQLTSALRNWSRCVTSIGGDGIGAQIIAKLSGMGFPVNTEVGVFLGEFSGNLVLLGLRNDGGGLKKVFLETFREWQLVQSTMLTDLGAGVPAALWLHLKHAGSVGFGGGSGLENFTGAWSITSGTSGFAGASLLNPRRTDWAGMYARSIGGASVGTTTVHFDDVAIRAPLGPRSSHWYVYRNPAIAGAPDLAAATLALARLRHAQTHSAVITSKSCLHDDASSGHDLGPCGAL